MLRLGFNPGRGKNFVERFFAKKPPAIEEVASQREQILYRWTLKMGREPNLSSPRNFSEKVLRRIVCQSDPIYPLIGYKHLAPTFVQSVIGDRVRIPKKLLVSTQLKPDDFKMLPSSFVLKSSYGSRLNKLVTDKSMVDWAQTCGHFNSQIGNILNARLEPGRWNCIIAEEYLRGTTGQTPDDLKVHCFHGRDGSFDYIFQLDSNRHEDHRQTLFDASGKPLPFMFKGKTRHETQPALPPNLDHAIELARDLSRGFDYIRVDLYSISGEIWFGELTPFHQGGMFMFDDPKADEWVGDKWDQRFPWFDRYNFDS